MPVSHRDDALAILRRLREHGHVAYFAGGCVRDLLLGLDAKDYDIATDAPPPRVRELFSNTQAVGAKFGVILVRHGKSVIEVATFRSDVSYEDGRHPTEVRFTTAEEDAKRRDFTINGLFLDPIENKVIDYVGGEADLKAKIVRAIGNPEERFKEDHLRMLRAIRFAARFGFKIERKTEQAICESAPELARISPERIAEELRLMLTPPSRITAWDLISASVENVIFRFLTGLPETDPDAGVPVNRFGQIFDRLSPGSEVRFGLALATAALDRAWPTWPVEPDLRYMFQPSIVSKIVTAMRKALKISNEESDELRGTLLGLNALLDDTAPSTATLKRFLAQPTAILSRQLMAALPAELLPDRRKALEQRLSELEETDFAPVPLITGDDLTAVGLAPGPVFKRVLDAVYDAQLEDRVTTKDEAMKLAMEVAREGE